jgi:hypothetical protein
MRLFANSRTSRLFTFSLLCAAFLAGSAHAAVSVSVKPRVAPLTFTQTQQFKATVLNTTNTAVTWRVDGIVGGNSTVGTITTSGLYTPPKASGTHSIRATSKADSTRSASATVIMTNYSGVFTWRGNNFRNGLNNKEIVLTTSNVKSSQFGKLFSRSVDGQVYAQPLYVSNLSISGVGFRNVVYVATQHDSVYAFDADGKRSSAYWKRSFINSAAGVTTATSSAIPETNITPEVGITGTPAIDPASKILYVVAKTVENGTYVQRLHALDLATGAERLGGPVKITASVPGSGLGSVGGMLRFDAAASRYALQRPGLTLSAGVVFVAFGLHLDRNGFHGWVMGYDAKTLGQRFAFCVTPDQKSSLSNDGKGGVWLSGAGLATDSTYQYFSSGNGSFTANSGGRDYGDSVIKMTNTGNVAKFFTPFDEATLQTQDIDLGSGGPVLVTGQDSAHPRLLITMAKSGKVYVLDRDDMGGFNPAGDTQIIQSMQTPARGIFGSAAVWNNLVYIAGNRDPVRAFTLSNNLLSTTSVSQSATAYGFPGASPIVTANGSVNGIVWTLERVSGGQAVLHAYQATNLATELYNSNQAGTRDQPGLAIKFAVPVAANGKVFVGADKRLTVYGLLP